MGIHALVLPILRILSVCLAKQSWITSSLSFKNDDSYRINGNRWHSYFSCSFVFDDDAHSILGVPVRPEAPPSELAVAVARHFEQMEMDEEECIGGFLERLEHPIGITEYTLKTQHFDGHAPSLAVRKRKRNKWAARPGEQVAAKVTRTDENGSWILASVQRFYSDTETYDVQDEDDTSKLIRLPWTHVMRLSSGTEGIFSKGKDCMAIFPETTSFYRAKVSKVPVWKMDKGGIPMVKEIIVKFEDDEDPQGRTPHRRVPARYVIPVPSDYFYEEMEDVDLSLAAAAAAAAAATNPAAVPSTATAAAANTSTTGAASSTGSSSSPILTTTASATTAVK